MTFTASSQWTPTHGKLLLAVSLEPREIGRRIAAARERRGWTQLTFALEANVSPSTVTRWESGKLPPVRELMRIAELLQVNPEDLVEHDPPADPDEQLEALREELADVRASLRALDDVKAALGRIEALLHAGEGDAPATPSTA